MVKQPATFSLDTNKKRIYYLKKNTYIQKERGKIMKCTALEEELKNGVISQDEYDYLVQHRTSLLPLYYNSYQFIGYLVIVPILKHLLFIGFYSLFHNPIPMLANHIFWSILFLGIFYLCKNPPLKMAAWVWFIITLASLLVGTLFPLWRI